MSTRGTTLSLALILVFAIPAVTVLGHESSSPARPAVLAAPMSGPTLEVTGDLIDPIITDVTTTPVTEIDVAPGTPISFCLAAEASGFVVGYRTAWDIVDPDDDEAWGVPFTPFPEPTVCTPLQGFMAGSHMFYAEVIDDVAGRSRVPILVHIVEPTPVEPTTWGRIKALYSE